VILLENIISLLEYLSSSFDI